MYLTPDTFRNHTIAPSEYIDGIEDRSPGWLSAQLEQWSAWIDSRLRKRYAVPFSNPAPLAVRGWLAAIVTCRLYLRYGVSAADEQFQIIRAEEEAARAEVLEAANSETGLFDLPLASGASGITKGGTISYSEASPFVHTTVQANAARDEDANGGGTYG